MSNNSKEYLSFASLSCVLLIPLWIGLASTNIMEGGLRGIVAIFVLFVLPLIAGQITSTICNKHKGGKDCIFYVPTIFSITFSITFVIVVIAMLVTNT